MTGGWPDQGKPDPSAQPVAAGPRRAATLQIEEDGLGGYRIKGASDLDPRMASALRCMLDDEWPQDCGPGNAAA